MRKYIGTKNVKAELTTKEEYCSYRGWEVPKGEDPKEVIYLVEYEADPLSKPNHPDHEGYITMSPKHVFEQAYMPSETYKERLIIERDNLAIKIGALINALDSGQVPASSESILQTQLKQMGDYLSTLNIRIG